MSAREMILSRSESTDSGCRVWLRGRDWDGYGILRVDGRSRRAHRLAYEVFVGPIPAGMVVRHTCDNPPCVNPAHLLVGTIAENNRDREARGRSADRNGERCPTAKLTWAEVVAIRRDLAVGRSHASLALQHGVSRKAVSKIARGETWKPDLTPEQYATAQRRA